MFKYSNFSLKFILIAFLFNLSLSSCNDEQKVSSAIEGSWSIDTIYYKGMDIRYCLDLNTINFKGLDCELPLVPEGNCTNVNPTFEKTASWEIYQTDSVPISMVLKTQNPMFAGSHRIVFKKDPINKLLKMEIKSDSLLIICRKFLFSFDSNTKLIDDLVRLSK